MLSDVSNTEVAVLRTAVSSPVPVYVVPEVMLFIFVSCSSCSASNASMSFSAVLTRVSSAVTVELSAFNFKFSSVVVRNVAISFLFVVTLVSISVTVVLSALVSTVDESSVTVPFNSATEEVALFTLLFND